MTENETEGQIKIEDRRSFDREGNLREEAPQKSEAQPAPQDHHHEHSHAPDSEGEPIDFISILYSYVHTALVCMGEMDDPIQRKKIENLPGAKEMIDILELFQRKTMGNLEPRESEFLEGVLFDLRMRYLKRSQIVK